MDTLTLTDDEAVALAVTLSEPWRAPLPTVDLSSKDDLAGALFRGRRSLAVRDLTDAEGTPAGLADTLLKRMGTGLRAMFLLADGDGNWLPDGVTLYLYGLTVDDIELSHVVAAAGVHYFRIAPPPGQWEALTGLAGTVFTDGFGGDDAAGAGPRPAAAMLSAFRPDGVRTIRVAHGRVTTGRGPVPASFPSVADAVSWLLG